MCTAVAIFCAFLITKKCAFAVTTYRKQYFKEKGGK